MLIKLLTLSDLEPYLQHVARNLAESGRGNTPIFAPYSSQDPWDANSRRQRFLDDWSKPLTQPGWRRAWACFDGDKMIGDVDLKAGSLKAGLHRAALGMGIEEGYRRHGQGKALLTTAINWAREQPALLWIDLGVFAHNEVARRLYRGCGFTETGRIDDLFRVDGQSIDDIQMTLKIR